MGGWAFCIHSWLHELRNRLEFLYGANRNARDFFDAVMYSLFICPNLRDNFSLCETIFLSLTWRSSGLAYGKPLTFAVRRQEIDL